VKGDDSKSTFPRLREATAMFVGMEPSLAEECEFVLSTIGYRVLKVGHAAAACERIPVAMPTIVVITSNAKENERADLQERVIAVGAKLVVTPALADPEGVLAIVREAAIAALEGAKP
jgi:hypothetical protein